MIQLEEINNPAKAHTSSGFSLLSRQLVVFFAATLSLALPAISACAAIRQTRTTDRGCDQDARGENQLA